MNFSVNRKTKWQSIVVGFSSMFAPHHTRIDVAFAAWLIACVRQCTIHKDCWCVTMLRETCKEDHVIILIERRNTFASTCNLKLASWEWWTWLKKQTSSRAQHGMGQVQQLWESDESVWVQLHSSKIARTSDGCSVRPSQSFRTLWDERMVDRRNEVAVKWPFLACWVGLEAWNSPDTTTS